MMRVSSLSSSEPHQRGTRNQHERRTQNSHRVLPQFHHLLNYIKLELKTRIKGELGIRIESHLNFLVLRNFYYTSSWRNTYMVRKHHMAVLLANHVRVLCMRLCVSGGFHAQYTYMIDPGAQPHGTPGPCKYFSYLSYAPRPSTKIIFHWFEQERHPKIKK